MSARALAASGPPRPFPDSQPRAQDDFLVNDQAGVIIPVVLDIDGAVVALVPLPTLHSVGRIWRSPQRDRFRCRRKLRYVPTPTSLESARSSAAFRRSYRIAHLCSSLN